jgi:hypothetical protein
VSQYAMNDTKRSGVPTLAPKGSGDLGVTMEVKGGGVVKSLDAIRPYGRGVPPLRALDMFGSLHLINGYLITGYKGDE